MSFILACMLLAANVESMPNPTPSGGSIVVKWVNPSESGAYGNDLICHDFCVYAPDKSLASMIGFRENNEILAMRGGPEPEYRFVARDSDSGQTWTCSSSDSHETVSLKRKPGPEVDAYTIEMKRKDIPVRVTLNYECFPGHRFVRRQINITNIGTTKLVLDDVALEAVQVTDCLAEDLGGMYGFERVPGEQRPLWFDLHEVDLKKNEAVEFDSGRWRAATWLQLERKKKGTATEIQEKIAAARTPLAGTPRNDEGGAAREDNSVLIMGWETYAVTQCRVDRNCTAQVVIRPQVVLEAGKTFSAPWTFIGVCKGDRDEACYRTQRFVEDHIAWPAPDDQFPYLMFNSWGYGTQIDEKLAYDALDKCAGLGVELFVVDFGWEGPDWLPRPEIFPNGLAPIGDACRAKGMKYGFHFSFTNVSEKSKVYQEHPDWVYGEGCWAYGHDKYKTYALSVAMPEAREWAAEKAVEVLDREKMDWWLTDTHIWGHIDPQKQTTLGNTEYVTPTGFAIMMDDIRKRKPNILIEHCDGGLSLPSYLMMRQHVTSITCDNANAIDTRLSVYDLSHFMPPRYLDKYQQEWRSHYANRSCMFGGPWILMTPIHTLDKDSRDWRELVDDIAVYKKYRKRIRDGKVLHLLRPSVPTDASWDGWDAIGSYNPREDAAIVFAFRTRGDKPDGIVPMKALRPDGKYKVAYLDEGTSYSATGEQIMKDGFRMRLDAYDTDHNSHCSEIMLVEPEMK